jgi:hypothetical protein
MVCIRSCFLGIAAALIVLASGNSQTRKFYPDDPIDSDASVRVTDIKTEFMPCDYFYQTGRQQPSSQPALGVNTGEVPNNAWFTVRHGRIRDAPQLQQGAGAKRAAAPL